MVSQSKNKLYAILEFYAQRNGNKKYSAALYKRFIKDITLLIKNPDLGIQSSKANIRGLIILDYIIFYELEDSLITIHTIWPTHQNPDKLIL